MNHNEKLAREAKSRRQMLLHLNRHGYSVTQLAAKYGISKQRVSQLLKLARDET